MQNKEQLREENFAMIASWQQSGLTQKQYCEQKQVAYHHFHYWYRRYRMAPENVEKNESPFVAVKAPAYSAHTELMFVDGRRLVFHQPVSADFLKALIG
jgi:hypothetical protein